MRLLPRAAVRWIGLAFAPAVLSSSAPGRAGDHDARAQSDHDFEQVRFAVNAVSYGGTELVGVGSRGRYSAPGGAIELGVERFPHERIGVGVFLQGFAAALGQQNEALFVRGELLLEAGLASWRGSAPGSLVLGAGLGGDVGRYWFAEDGRAYGLALLRLRLWLSPETPLQLTYAAIPAAATAGEIDLHEHRFELATGWSLLQLGTRITTTFVRGGEPARGFFQHELGGFVGIAVY